MITVSAPFDGGQVLNRCKEAVVLADTIIVKIAVLITNFWIYVAYENKNYLIISLWGLVTFISALSV
jgi:hypothetical protein